MNKAKELKEAKLLEEARDEIARLNAEITSREEEQISRTKLEEELKILRAAELNWKKEVEMNEAQWAQRREQLESQLMKENQVESDDTKLLLDAQAEIARLRNQNNALKKAQTEAEVEAQDYKEEKEIEREKLQFQLNLHRKGEARLRSLAEEGEANMRNLLTKYLAETKFLKSSEMALKQQLKEERAKMRNLRNQHEPSPGSAGSIQQQTFKQEGESHPERQEDVTIDFTRDQDPASRRIHDNAIAQHGWFEKQSGQFSIIWQKRYFVLFQNGELSYYPDEESAFDGSKKGKAVPVQSWKLDSERAIYGHRFILLECKGRQSNMKLRPCHRKESGRFVDDATSWVTIGNKCLRSQALIESMTEDPIDC